MQQRVRHTSRSGGGGACGGAARPAAVAQARRARGAAAPSAALTTPGQRQQRPRQRHQQQRQQQRRGARGVACCAAGEGGGGDELTAVFSAELARRSAAQAAAAEAEAAAGFDGGALLALSQQRWGRSYDFSLVQRQYMGKTFVALNVMWKYREQASWSYTEEEFAARLDYIAAAIVAWGAVKTVQSQIASTKERPRVGKAVSIFLDVPPERAAEWLAS